MEWPNPRLLHGQPAWLRVTIKLKFIFHIAERIPDQIKRPNKLGEVNLYNQQGSSAASDKRQSQTWDWP